jgi:GMP synthase-like glutamine amidotransferase/RimJ/RimL family protein N-acetyltransferase
MRIHYLQHVPFEGLGSMELHLRAQGHMLTSTHLYIDSILPEPADIDWLIVMGGPMGVYDEALYPWLIIEKRFIREVIAAGKRVLGICLGAQLLAEALGAQVYRNKYREIGWFSVQRMPGNSTSALFAVFPAEAEVFHWHGDTFDLPKQTTLLASSEACRNQAFVFRNQVLALQFHLETTPQSAADLIAHCGNELDGSRYVQDAAELLGEPQRFAKINRIMADVLDTFAALLVLRRATPADAAVLRHWDTQSHIVEAKGDGDWQWESELAKKHPASREQLIADVNGKPIGYLEIIDPALDEEHYWGDIEPNQRAIDLWIGEPEYIGKGYGTRMMELALARCFADHSVKAIVIDPLGTNTRAIRFYERLGFEFVERRQFGDDDCSVFQLTRSRYEQYKLGQ